MIIRHYSDNSEGPTTLVTWVSQNRLALGLRPPQKRKLSLADKILPPHSLACTGGYVWPCRPNKSLFLLKPTLYP